MTRKDQQNKKRFLREAAKAICNAATLDCAMNDPKAPGCDDRTCLIYSIARDAIKEARRRCGEEEDEWEIAKPPEKTQRINS